MSLSPKPAPNTDRVSFIVSLDGKAVGEGQGKNKAQAQIAAAKAAYIKLKNKGDTL